MCLIIDHLIDVLYIYICVCARASGIMFIITVLPLVALLCFPLIDAWYASVVSWNEKARSLGDHNFKQDETLLQDQQVCCHPCGMPFFYKKKETRYIYIYID